MAPRASWGSQGCLGELWGVSGAPRVGFWDLLGRPGGVPGRRPIMIFRRQIIYKYEGFGAWAIFSDVKGRLDFVFSLFSECGFCELGR